MSTAATYCLLTGEWGSAGMGAARKGGEIRCLYSRWSTWLLLCSVCPSPCSCPALCQCSPQAWRALEWDSSGIPQVGHLLQGRGMGRTVSSVEVGGAVGGATACECTLVQIDLQ